MMRRLNVERLTFNRPVELEIPFDQVAVQMGFADRMVSTEYGALHVHPDRIRLDGRQRGCGSHTLPTLKRA